MKSDEKVRNEESRQLVCDSFDGEKSKSKRRLKKTQPAPERDAERVREGRSERAGLRLTRKKHLNSERWIDPLHTDVTIWRLYIVP